MSWPNFIICGMKKAATTSLYEYLQQHPDVYMSSIKEPKYFLFDPDDPFFVNAPLRKYPIRTEEEYLALFAGVKHERAIGEASPSYAMSDRARRQISAVIPNAKLIFSLRNPVDRLYSAHQMGVRGGSIDASFDEYIESNWHRLPQFEYSRFLRPWVEDFSRTSLMFVLSENLRLAPSDEISRLYRFLDVDDSFVPDRLREYNSGGIPRRKRLNQLLFYIRKHPYKRSIASVLPTSARNAFNRIYVGNLEKAPAMSPETRRLLNAYFEEDVAELSQLIDLDLSIWSRQRPVSADGGAVT